MKQSKKIFLFFGLLVSFQIFAEVEIVVEASKPIAGETESNAIKITLNNTSGSSADNNSVNILLPDGFTEGSASVPSGTSYTPGTPGVSPGVWSSVDLNGNEQEQLSIPVTIDPGTIGTTLITTATITASDDAGSVGNEESTDVHVQCAFIDWSVLAFDNAGDGTVSLSNFNDSFNENYSSQGVAFTLDAVNKSNSTTFRLQEDSLTNIGPTLELRGLSGWEVEDQNPITDTPAGYGEVVITFDPTVYPNGVAGVSYFVYDVDTSAGDNTFRDGIVTFGIESDDSTRVIPNVTLSSVTEDIILNAGLPASIVHNNGNANFDDDDPRGLVVYQFPSKIKTLVIRYYNQSPATSSTQKVNLSNIYRDCVSDIDLTINGADVLLEPCQIVTYTLCAVNDGPAEAQNVRVRGIVPQGVDFVSSNPSTGSFDDGANEWFIGDINVPGKETLEVTVQVKPESANMTLKQTATIYSPDVVDTDPSNNEFDLSFIIGPITQPTIANDDSATTPFNTPVVIPVPDNDNACGLDLSSVTIITSPNFGVITDINPVTGEITYKPNPGFSGVDTFMYQICNVANPPSCDTATVTVTVGVNPTALQSPAQPPLAVNDYAETDKDVPVVIDVLTNDLPSGFPLDPASISIDSLPSNGMVVEDLVTGQITYTPNMNFVGMDSFNYQICDSRGMPFCSIATVYVNVKDSNVPDPREGMNQLCNQ